MPPTNVKHTFMKCKICSQLIDHMDLTAHANMHRKQGHISGGEGSMARASPTPTDNVNAQQKSNPVGSAECPLETDKKPHPVQTTPQQAIPEQVTSEQFNPEQTTPDQTIPDQTTHQQTTPQQITPQQTTPQQVTAPQPAPHQTSSEQAKPQQTSPPQIAHQTTPQQTSSNQTTPDQATSHQTAPDQVRPQQITLQKSTPKQITQQSAIPQQDLPQQIAPHQATPEQSTTQQTTSEETTPKQTTPEKTMPEQTMPEHAAPNQTTTQQTTLELTTSEQTTPEQTNPHESVTQQLAPEQTTPHQTTQEWTTLDQTTLDETTPDQTTPDQTTPDQTTPNQTTPEQSTPEQITPGQTTPPQTAPQQTTSDQSTIQQTTADQTTPEQSTPDQSTPGQTTPERATLDQTAPEETNPVQINPDQTSAEQAIPTQTTPDLTNPDQTTPEQAISEQTSPQQTTPQQITPQQSIPQQTTPKQAPSQNTTPQKAVLQTADENSNVKSPQSIPKSLLVEASHLFVTEKVAAMKKDSQLFTCELCRSNSGAMGVDSYAIHLTQPVHMKSVFVWLLEAKADVVYKYKMLAAKLRASKKTEGLFCEFCRKASFNVRDLSSHHSHLTSDKHMSLVKSLKESYNQVRAKVSGDNKRAADGNVPAASNTSPSKKQKLDLGSSTDVHRTKSTTSVPGSSKGCSTSPTSVSKHSQKKRRSPSWSPLRNSTPSPNEDSSAQAAEIKVINLDAADGGTEKNGKRSQQSLSASLSKERRSKDGRSNHSRSSPRRRSQKSRSPNHRSRSSKDEHRSSSIGKRRHRSKSPRNRRSRSRKRSRRSRSQSRERKSSHRLSLRQPSSISSARHPASSSATHPASSRDRHLHQQQHSRKRSPDRQKFFRSRSPDSRRLSHIKSSFSRLDVRGRGRSPVHQITQRPESHKKQLRPRPLSPWSIDSLTFLVEKKWTNYYERYYCAGMRDEALCLVMQKEYLQAYKGFFVEDPNFDLCYTQLLKPEALRTLLTERIDRGSPGPSTIGETIDSTLKDFDTIEPGELVDDERRKELRKQKWDRRLGEKAAADATRSLVLPYKGNSGYSSRYMPPSPIHREHGLLSKSVPVPVPAPVPAPGHASVHTAASPGMSSSQAAASVHSFDKLKALIRESLKIPTAGEPKGAKAVLDRSIEVPDLVKQALHQINTSKVREMEPKGPACSTHPSSAENLIFQDPFLGFVHHVLSGILKMTGLQDKVDSGNAPAGARSELYHEQRRMHESMVTPEGHLLIRMARMTLTNINRLDSKFGASHADVVTILKNLDRDVLQLIADTPMLKQ